jgi:ABC-type transport system substrate-binding protein
VCRNKSSDLSSFYASGATPSLTIEPNPYFFGRHPQYRMVWRVIKDSQTAYLEYKAGQEDASEIPSTFIAQNLGKRGVFHFNTFLVWYLSPAYDVAPFDNIHCRLALAYAIDTNTLDKTVLHGSWAPLHSLMPRGVPGYYAGKDNPSYNTTKARSELAQCPSGIHNQTIVYETYNTDMDDSFAGAIPAMLSAVGIGAKGSGVPTAPWLKLATATQKSTNTPLLQVGLTGPDPNTWCNLRKTGFVLNTANFSNAKYDGLCARGAATFNSAKAAKVYQQAGHIALSQGTYIPIGQVQQFAVSKFSGVVGDPSWTQLAPRNYDWANITVK